MADLHHLPEPPLPEGWEPSSMFAAEWVRPVRWTRPTREDEMPMKALLYVAEQPDVGLFVPTIREADGSTTTLPLARSLHAAIAAVEAAYCNSHIRKE